MKLSILLAGSILTSAIVGKLYLYRQYFRLCQHPDEVPL